MAGWWTLEVEVVAAGVDVVAAGVQLDTGSRGRRCWRNGCHWPLPDAPQPWAAQQQALSPPAPLYTYMFIYISLYIYIYINVYLYIYIYKDRIGYAVHRDVRERTGSINAQ
jgi:hypothetical protein